MKQIPHWLILLAILFFAAAAIWYFSNIIVCLLLAGIHSLLFRPLTDFIRKIRIGKFHVPASLAALTTLFFVAFIVITGFLLLVPLLVEQATIFNTISLNNLMNDLRRPIEQLESFLFRYHMLTSPDEQSLRLYLQMKITEVLQWIDYTSLLESVFKTTSNFLFMTFSTVFMLFFFLKEEDLFMKIISVFVPEDKKNQLENAFQNVRQMLSRYLMGMAVQIVCIIVYVSVLLHVLHIGSALLIGVLAGLLNIIPYLGPLFGFIIGLILASVVHLNESGLAGLEVIAFKMLIVFVSVQLIDNYILQPFIYSSSTRSHPLEIFIVILAAGTLAGITGMIVAVPVYTILRIIAIEFFSDHILIARIRKL